MIRRTYALVILGIGCAVLVAALAKLLPTGSAMIGGAVAFFGLLLTGLSFIRPHVASPDAPPPMTPFERITGIFFEPARVFQNLRAHPRWLAALLIVALFQVIYTTAFTQRVTPERIINYTTDKLAETGFVPPEQVERSRQDQLQAAHAPTKHVGNVVNAVVFTFLLLAFISALYWVGVLMFGGRINYWQTLAVVAHAWLPVTIIQKSLSLLLLYLKDPADVHPILGQNGLVQDNLGVLFSPAEHPVLFAAASAIGILSFYLLWLTATGLRNGGERVSSSAAWSVTIGFWLIAVAFMVGWTALFPNFIS
jgi:hypothetical protein